MAWYSLPDWLTGYDSANAAAANAADSKRQELDSAAAQSGKISQEEYNRRLALGYGVDQASQRSEIDQAFGDSVVENAKSISSGVANTLSFTVWRILSAVPPVVWILAALGLFIYMGGGTWLQGRLGKKR